ncbi:LktC [Anaerovibrio sp. JC8]|uniref:hypothetical protein n=1 Tax=Anaerovibrio sp. JC8 TaxID=1240085 RepID=UPI000A0AE7E5|nr:hypothetical protein [Anaerovibrio sp. JC8]ORU01122.1 LktC [Anaerovibrio sp. JC8]
MNTKAKVFSKYLKEKEIEVFQVEEIPEDEHNTVVFRSHIVVEGQQLPTLVILDDTAFSVIRVLILNNALTSENELKVLYMANTQNMNYKPFKLYFDRNGALLMDVCLTTPGQKEKDFSNLGDEIYGMLDLVIKFMGENYRTWMKEIW